MRTTRFLSAALSASLALACEGEGVPPGLAERAARLSREMLILDTHIDVPYRLGAHWEDVSQRTERGDFDHPRARAGGLDTAFMSIYVPASYQESGGARAFADQLIDLVESLARDHPEKFAVVRSPREAREAFGGERVALALGMENGAPLEGDLANLAHFHRRGIRYITLTHSKNNAICDSSYATERQWGGLSPFGREVVAEMNRLGVMIDVSHVSDQAFYQVMEASKAPVIASHSSCRTFTPGWERNMDDEMIRRLAAGGGVLQINFGSDFLRQDSHLQGEEFWRERTRLVEEKGLAPEAPEVKAFEEQYWRQHARIFADVTDVADHIDHVVALVGIDHVGLGSDFDGVGDSLPTGLKDVSGYPNLLRVLLERGYSEEDLTKIAGGNLLRVWEEVERLAAP